MGLVKADIPTETRPRHVALLAGFNEDIYNIRNAWRTNIRHFDTILHNTQFSWAYGHSVALSPLKLPPGDPRNLRLKLEDYNAVPYDPILVDKFVFNKFQAFITFDLAKFVELDEKNDDGRCGKLLFLHLSSVDDVAHRVGSKDNFFYQTLNNADNLVKEIHRQLRLHLNQEALSATTFIVTADHGIKPEGVTSTSLIFMLYSFALQLPGNAKFDTSLKSSTQGTVPLGLLNTSKEVKASLVRDNICHLMKLREALIRRSNRHSILPLFYAHKRKLPNDFDDLLVKEMALQNSLKIVLWAAWFMDFIFWTISMVLLSLSLAISLMDSQPCGSPSKLRFYIRLGVFGLASTELCRGMESCNNLTTSQINRRSTCLKKVKGFDEPRCFAAAGALLTVDLFFDEVDRRKGKYMAILLLILALFLGLWMCILHDHLLLLTILRSRGFQVMFVLLLALFWFLFTRQIGAVKVDSISCSAFLHTMEVLQFLPYHPGKSDFSLGSNALGVTCHATECILLVVNFPPLGLLIFYIYATLERGHKQGMSALRAQALAWILLTPFTFVQGTANIGYTDSWSQITKHLAYFIYLSVGPLICALVLCCIIRFLVICMIYGC
ncbi:unnamed protein product [Hydatigera taeniaeformis]|uniref:GPI ethanolamine phosphate transferase 1 n=1 Tax=Hydatigena taeniaeformis TaxID=6205 RepID=A0A0R3X0A6_HYDTA|nr:unnamed protein product [Hydatigera taeniaeformis]